jgi:NADPH-dependent 7-cyano-7-deazaguanine reductase QueF
MNSYQKLKQKHEQECRELINDIVTLVENRDSMDAIEVEIQWRVRIGIEKTMMVGVYEQFKMETK